MSNMDTLAESNIQDLVDAVVTNIDELPEMQENMNESFSTLEEFLNHETEKDENVLYPFKRENQHEWRKEKIIIDRSLSKSYPVIKDLIASTYMIQKQDNTLDPNLESKLQALGSPNINIPINIPMPQQQLQTMGLYDRIKSAVIKPKTVAEVLENPWETTRDLTLEAMQVPNVWKKLAKAHSTGVLRAYFFKTGMENWRRIEVWYLESHVEPELMKMIDASEYIVRQNDSKTIANILMKYYEQVERNVQNAPFMH